MHHSTSTVEKCLVRDKSDWPKHTPSTVPRHDSGVPAKSTIIVHNALDISRNNSTTAVLRDSIRIIVATVDLGQANTARLQYRIRKIFTAAQQPTVNSFSSVETSAGLVSVNLSPRLLQTGFAQCGRPVHPRWVYTHPRNYPAPI